MSPYPSKIDRTSIVSAAREMIEENGVDAFSLGALAKTLEVSTPSLYNHIQNKADLLRALNTLTNQELVAALRSVPDGPPETMLVEIARAYRAFAHRYPVTYNLAYSDLDEAARPDPAELEALAIPIQHVVAHITDESLPALRGLWAMIHGFVVLELNEQFRRGGDLEAALDASVRALIRGWQHD